MFAHTTFKILPPERVENGLLIHKDWYNKEENQLCLTNEDMTKHFIDNLEKHIAKHPDSPYFSVEIEDNSSFCNCESCKASHEKYGGASGTYIRFVNRVAQEINVWQKKELPDSRFKLVVFAYLWTKNPPVRYGEGGKYTLLENTANFRIIGNGVIKRRSFVPRILRRIRSDVGR